MFENFKFSLIFIRLNIWLSLEEFPWRIRVVNNLLHKGFVSVQVFNGYLKLNFSRPL